MGVKSLIRKANRWQPSIDCPTGRDQKVFLEFLIKNCLGRTQGLPIQEILHALKNKFERNYSRESFQHNILVPLKEQTDFFIGTDTSHGAFFIVDGEDAAATINFYRNRIRSEQKHLRNLKTISKRNDLFKNFSPKLGPKETKSIYFDESGTPSLKISINDQYFIIGAVILNSKDTENKITSLMSAILHRLGLPENAEIKSNRIKPSEYKWILNKFSKVDYEFAAICFVKKNLKSTGYKIPKNLYKQAYKFLVESVLDYVGEVNLYFDEYSKIGSSFEREFFEYLKKENLGFTLNRVDTMTMVESHKNRFIQFADLLVGIVKNAANNKIDLTPWIEEKIIDVQYFPFK